jgi:hypothetical protein
LYTNIKTNNINKTLLFIKMAEFTKSVLHQPSIYDNEDIPPFSPFLNDNLKALHLAPGVHTLLESATAHKMVHCEPKKNYFGSFINLTRCVAKIVVPTGASVAVPKYSGNDNVMRVNGGFVESIKCKGWKDLDIELSPFDECYSDYNNSFKYKPGSYVSTSLEQDINYTVGRGIFVMPDEEKALRYSSNTYSKPGKKLK